MVSLCSWDFSAADSSRLRSGLSVMPNCGVVPSGGFNSCFAAEDGEWRLWPATAAVIGLHGGIGSESLRASTNAPCQETHARGSVDGGTDDDVVEDAYLEK